MTNDLDIVNIKFLIYYAISNLNNKKYLFYNKRNDNNNKILF
jgi:hypothetical protein